ncbi:hypothetical protein TVAGG3_0717120 [Trichomonas vaginalis G3]|uniref:hypothetical protein n=1 Tax=Trichomonas vaginalis (strain ATCC PRA-98 / G3) TaxID=412133 RepID=UPI0021E5844E|nr:hypothetical protein TVAGG3_0717120 [Trichomonas vaginalis G3]KAI5510328.1 hypothetical protein TVAGG3_0717120 [Trichomonas vaginalis G3]
MKAEFKPIQVARISSSSLSEAFKELIKKPLYSQQGYNFDLIKESDRRKLEKSVGFKNACNEMIKDIVNDKIRLEETQSNINNIIGAVTKKV